MQPLPVCAWAPGCGQAQGVCGSPNPQHPLKATFPPPWTQGTVTGGVWESLDSAALMPAGHRQ